ncbi:MAG: ABC transporter permease, partial [Planctomycetes bacterium]|nr:ABC transporter permease [Planctomycetota bacterium]
RRNKGAMVGLVVFVLIVLSALLAPFLAPYDPLLINPVDYLQAPGQAHLFGTDSYGRDVFSRALYGGRVSLRVGLLSVVIAMVLGTVLGLIAGYAGGVLDNIIMRFVDMLLAFPGLLLALGVVALLGPGLDNVIIAVGISGLTGFARLVRGSVLSLREEVCVEAARSIGCPDWKIMYRHILPNTLGPIIVMSTLDIAWAILTASSLSFLGLGAQPPTPEWGMMLSEGRALLREAPWQTMFPGMLIMITVLSVNLFGDGLRDALDPRMYG